MYDLYDWFLQLLLCGGHCTARGVFSACLLACFLYDWGNWFFQLPLCGGQCTACGVFSTCLLACFLYDWGNWFFQLPFSGGHFVVGGCSRFYSMLVWCTTEETSFFSCQRWEISLLWLVSLSHSHSMLVVYDSYD